MALLLPLFFAGTALAQGGGKEDVPLVATVERNAAAGFALTQAAYAEKMVVACQPVMKKAGLNANDALEGWRVRNAAYVQAAHGWLLYVKTWVGSTKGDEAGTSFQKRTLTALEDAAEAMKKDAFAKDRSQEAVCGARLADLSDSRLDVYASKQHGQSLEEILAFHRKVTNQ